jgi:hypothetical protein
LPTNVDGIITSDSKYFYITCFASLSVKKFRRLFQDSITLDLPPTPVPYTLRLPKVALFSFENYFPAVEVAAHLPMIEASYSPVINVELQLRKNYKKVKAEEFEELVTKLPDK